MNPRPSGRAYYDPITFFSATIVTLIKRIASPAFPTKTYRDLPIIHKIKPSAFFQPQATNHPEQVPSLFVIRGRDQGTRFELTEATVSVGRDASNTIQLHDTEASRRHAELRLSGNAYTLTDLRSSNGTFVNGQLIEQRELVSGDQVQFGRSVMLYTGSSEQSAEELAEHVSIVSRSHPSDNSRIVRTMSQQEGSAILDSRVEDSKSPWLARARSNLQIMYRTALAVSHTLDIDQLLSRIMDLIFEWVEADRGCIMLFDPEHRKLRPKVRRQRMNARGDEKISISRTILDYVTEHNEGVLTSNAKEDERWDTGQSILQLGVREAICVPMRGRYDVVGVIYIDTSIAPQRIIQQGGQANKFTEEHLKLMIAIAHQAALAVEDTSYYKAMVQAERLAAVGQTVATLSHHVKNVLQGIRGGSYLVELGLSDHKKELAGEAPDLEKLASAVEMIRKGWSIVDKNQDKISTLVLDMLTFSKQRDPEPAPADMNELVGEVIELMRGRARDLDVRLEWRPDPTMPTLMFDPDGLHRAVLNIVTNAIDACDLAEDALVQVKSQYLPREKLLRVIVQDNGVGISPDDLEQVFGLFVSKKGGRGTGLGLPVSQKIVREHGGQILVESEPGQGSRFTLELPAVSPHEMPTPSAADGDSRNLTVTLDRKPT
jgi:signal transduction histidine kinase